VLAFAECENRSQAAEVGGAPRGAWSSSGQRQHVLSLLRVGAVRLFDKGTVRRAAQRLCALPGAPGDWKVGRVTRSGASPFFTESLNSAERKNSAAR
jgi:hypothetical protein